MLRLWTARVEFQQESWGLTTDRDMAIRPSTRTRTRA
jgi:hypothetical protein